MSAGHGAPAASHVSPVGTLKTGDHLKTLDELIDDASMDSFPASDAPSFWARGGDETRVLEQAEESENEAAR